MKFLQSRWILWAARLILGLVFCYAAILKISAPLDFADSIATYQILPTAAINLLALGLPWFELACGLLVLIGFMPRIGTLGLLVMLIVFTAAITSALVRGLTIDCGCFGSHSWLDTNPWIAFMRDVLLSGLTACLYHCTLLRHQSGPIKASKSLDAS